MKGTYAMRPRIFLAVAAAIGVLAAASPVRAQVASTAPTPGAPSGWTFSLAPYAWLPTISSTVSYTGPRGATITNNVSAGIGDYISDLNFALMLGGAARYGRFSVLTDLVYTNASLTTSNSHFSAVNLGPGPIYIPRSQQLDTGSRLHATVWSLAGGYTLLEGAWGNLDAVAGLRMLFLGSTSNYTLTNDILLPNRTIALSRSGSLTFSGTEPEGVGGITGRINIPNSRFYVPFYFDAGGGAVPLTWEAYTGIAYKVASWVDVSAGYRYLAFEDGSRSGIQKLDLGGAIIAANFRF
ncbi:MAG: hypothetical protein ACREFO_03310 [Acetobacteraceae bacterium]